MGLFQVKMKTVYQPARVWMKPEKGKRSVQQ
jgi:hypothetical protein